MNFTLFAEQQPAIVIKPKEQGVTLAIGDASATISVNQARQIAAAIQRAIGSAT